MTIKVFEEILKQAQVRGIMDRSVDEARMWIRKKSQATRTVNTQQIIKQANDQAVQQVKVGQLFLFRYNAKLKDELPYWDMFPIVFPFRKAPGGFYGINLHYIPWQFRAMLMDNLYDIMNNSKADETTKLRLSYNVLSSSAKFRWFKPCVKHYLNTQVSSKLIYIEPKEWEVALFLPLQKFQGATTAQVYRDSKNIVTRR